MVSIIDQHFLQMRGSDFLRAGLTGQATGITTGHQDTRGQADVHAD
jgi:hypothetical protein